MTRPSSERDIRSAAAKYVRAGRALEILVIPVITFIVIGRCLYGAAVDIWGVVIIATYLASLLLRRAWAGHPNWVDWSACIVVLSETVSYARSTYSTNSLGGYEDALFLFLFYCLVRFGLQHEYQRVGICLIVALFGLFLSAAASYSFLHQLKQITALGFNDATDFKWFFNFLQAPGTAVGEWITVFLILLPFPVLLFIRYVRTAPSAAWLLLCPAVAILLTVAATFSRGLYIATAFFFVSAGLLCVKYELSSLKHLMRYTAAALTVLFLIVCLTPLRRPALTTASMFKTDSQARSLEGRASLWQDSWEIVKDYPLFGVGAFNFPMHYAAYKEEGSAYVGRTFNIFLQLLVEKGVVGLLAYGLLFFSFLKVTHDNVRLLPDGAFQKTAALLFVASFAALIVRDLTYSSIITNKGVSTLLWFMFAHNARTTPPPADGV